ncbi:Fatty acid synthase [Papilio xuthus]|uniref:Fatty acid synthase n=1 Tax=Papilio xuthus TaxID=66420 RepID=A0A194QL01_PAPXU|nr:Fatty acid synthase [Papilio xuthus]
MHINGDGTGDGRGIPTGEEIVISGMSGKFPASKNVTEFMDNLYRKINMVIEVEPDIQDPEYPKHGGKIDDIDKFDATFFKVTKKQSLSLNAQCRQLIGHAYGAIYDSGINPVQMQDEKLGIFIASSTLGDKDILTDNCNNMKTNNNFFISG